MPNTYPSTGDLYLYQGANFVATVTVEYDDGSPVDMTGCVARAQIRRDVADVEDEIAAELSTLIESPHIKLSLDKEIVRELCGRYVWDLDLDFPDGTSWPVMSGKVLVTQEVTRETVMVAAGTRRR